MAKNPPDIEAQAIRTIKSFERDIENISGFITEEFIKIASSKGGEIDVNDPAFQSAINSMLNADPNALENQGKAVISLKATEQGILEKIDKLIEKGVAPDLFDDFKEQLSDFKQDFGDKLQSNEGLKGLVEERLKSKLMQNAVNFMELDEMGERRGMGFDDKNALVKRLSGYVEIPEHFQKQMIETGMPSKEMIDETREVLAQNFSKEGNNEKGWSTLNPDKLTDKQLQLFSSQSKDRLNALVIVQGVVSNIENKYGKSFAGAVIGKITKNLVPAISKLGSEYLQEHGKEVIDKISEQVFSKKKFLSSFLKSFNISSNSLEEVTTSINTESQKEMLDAEFEEHIREGLINSKMSNGELAEKLDAIYQENNANIPEHLRETFANGIDAKGVNNISDRDFAEIRHRNQELFDKVMFSQEGKPLEEQRQVKEKQPTKFADRFESKKQEGKFSDKFKKHLKEKLADRVKRQAEERGSEKQQR